MNGRTAVSAEQQRPPTVPPDAAALAIGSPNVIKSASLETDTQSLDRAVAATSRDSTLLLGQTRTNGFQRPYSRDQVISWLGHSISAISFYVAAVSLLVTGETDANRGMLAMTIVALSVHIPTVCLLLISWKSCEQIDPAGKVEETLPNGWFGVKLGGPRWEKTRYCALCRKSVPGLDHHCTWLQTCVGKSNYAQFFTIACTGALQFFVQALYATYCLVWLDLPFDHTGTTNYVIQGFFIVCLFISVPCSLMYFILLSFHVYLMFLGYGTYEWMLRRRRRQRERAAAKKAAATARQESHNSEVSTRAGSDSDTRPHLSSVGSGNDFVSADGPTSGKELTSL